MISTAELQQLTKRSTWAAPVETAPKIRSPTNKKVLACIEATEKPFTSADIQKATGCNINAVQMVLNRLFNVGSLKKIGHVPGKFKQSNGFILWEKA